MYKDLHRIEDAILPFLFRDAALTHINQDIEVAKYYQRAIEILDKTVEACFVGLSQERKTKLSRRLMKVVKKIVDYLVDNKFTTRKMFLALSEWNRCLLEGDAYAVPEDSEYYEFLLDLHAIILTHGYGEMADFDKIDASAINHVNKLHELTQQCGYFTA